MLHNKKATQQPIYMIGSLVMVVIMVVVFVLFFFPLVLGTAASGATKSIASDVLDTMCDAGSGKTMQQVVDVLYISGDTSKQTLRYYYYTIWQEPKSKKVYVEAYSKKDGTSDSEIYNGFKEWEPKFDELGNVADFKRIVRAEAKKCKGYNICVNVNAMETCYQGYMFSSSEENEVIEFGMENIGDNKIVLTRR